MIADYEQLLDRTIPKLSSETHATMTQLAGLPMEIKGFGHIKDANYKRAMVRQKSLLSELDNPPAPIKIAAE